MPQFVDPRIVGVRGQSGTPATPEAIGEIVDGAERVFVHHVRYFRGQDEQTIVYTLAALGFKRSDTIEADAHRVVVWEMPT